VPPDDPSYTLRRVWLTEEQEQGYYYGFSNEGLWPLCHLAYVRPAFRASDWRAYEEVNAKFAEVVAAEASTDSPVVLIQDFHFALLPKLIRKDPQGDDRAVLAHPLAECGDLRRVSVEARDADAHAVGGHSRVSHALSLPEFSRHGGSLRRMPDRSRAHDRDPAGHVCRVAPYPDLDRVAAALAAGSARCRRLPGGGARAPSHRRRTWSSDWASSAGTSPRASSSASRRSRRCSTRIRGIADGSRCCRSPPSRSQLPAYQALQQQTYSEVERINAKFAEGDWRPIVLIDEHQEPLRVFELYRAADFCLVNSLHDGMNLVAKEFVAARDDEDGVLILSTFAGASRELAEAVLINPFDVNETAEAMEIAMRMGRDERRNRMSLMRRTVKENNVYRWAGRMLMDAARIRSGKACRRRAARASGGRELAARARMRAGVRPRPRGWRRAWRCTGAAASWRGCRVEGRQRNGGDFRLANQPVGEIDIARRLSAHSRPGENTFPPPARARSPSRAAARPADRAWLEKTPTARPRIGEEREIARDGVLQRRDDAEGIELMHLAQFARQRRRRDAVADPPAGGVQRLAEGKYREAALAQFRVREHRCVASAVEQHVLVHFIGEHADGPVANQGRERVQIGAARDGATRILRTVDDDQAGAVAQTLGAPVPVEAKAGGVRGMRTQRPPARRTAGS
jgi:hypothetical protein